MVLFTSESSAVKRTQGPCKIANVIAATYSGQGMSLNDLPSCESQTGVATGKQKFDEWCCMLLILQVVLQSQC